MAEYSKNNPADNSEDLAKTLIKRWGKLESKRALWVREWREIADFIVPRKAVALRGSQTPSGIKTTSRIFSSVAIKANEDLASTMQGTLTNSSIRWFNLVFPFDELNEDPESAEWLEEVSDRLFKAFQQSNWQSVVHEGYIDLGGFGITCILLEEREIDSSEFSGFLFRDSTIGEYCVSESKSGVVDTVFRKFRLTVRAAADKFGKENLSDVAQKKLDIDPDAEIEILHAVYPREDADHSHPAAPKKRPWASCYIEFERKVKLQEGGYYEFPFLVPRWTKNSKEEYGRGPGHTALPDVKTLNRARELKLRQWAKAIDPPMQALDQGVVGSVKLTPSSLNFVREKDAIKPIESGARFDVASVNEQEIVSSIKEVFYSDLTSLPPIQGTPMSATEAAQRFEVMERKLGPTIGRLKVELLNPAIERGFAIMHRANAFPPVPEKVTEFYKDKGRADLQVKFEGPLEKSQRASDLSAIERTYVQLGAIAAVDPEVNDVIDHDKAARLVVERNGVPSFLLRSSEEIEALRKQRSDQKMAAMETAQAKEAAKAFQSGAAGVKDLSGAFPTSPSAPGFADGLT